jgi:16S rRNA (guanine527-N7)-methyltransferase
MMELIKKYFGSLESKQLEQLKAMQLHYSDWNKKINLISRKDMGHFYERHVLHSLAIALFIRFTPGTKVMDAGTGGGFPGIPLAVLFPETQFTLVDSIGKKIMVVESIAESLGLENVRPVNKRIEQVNEKFDFIVSRAVASLPDFMKWTENKLKGNSRCNKANGIIYLKGGDLTDELDALPKRYASSIVELSNWFNEPFFETKKLVHIF